MIPNKIKKMKVKYCIQVFSHTLGTAMRVLALLSKNVRSKSNFDIDPSSEDTAELLLFFDSVNGSTFHPQRRKELRAAVTEKSPNLEFWSKCLPVLKSMYYSSGVNNKKYIAP